MSRIFAYLGKNGEKELFLPCENEEFSVLSDGDIENAAELSKLYSKGFSFSNESALLLECLCASDEKNKTALLFKLTENIFGNISFAFCPKDESALYCKSGISKLFIGFGQNGSYLSDDFDSLLPFCEKYAVLENGYTAKLTKDKALVFDSKKRKIKPAFPSINKGRTDINSYQSLDENSCCGALARETYIKFVKSGGLSFDYLRLRRKYLSRLNKIILIASASSKSTALACRGLFENLCVTDTYALESEEFFESKTAVDKNTLVIAISQSGKNKATLEAVSKAKGFGAKTIAVTGNKNSALAIESDCLICPRRIYQSEIPSSASFVSDYFALCLFALYIGYKTNVISELFLGVSLKMAEMLSGIILSGAKLSSPLKKAANEMKNAKNIYVCSVGDNLFADKTADIIRETALKNAFSLSLSEISKLDDEMIKESTVLALINSREKLYSKCKTLSEIKKRGTNIIIVTSQSIAQETGGFENVLTYNDSLPIFAPLPCISLIYQISLLARESAEDNNIEQSA